MHPIEPEELMAYLDGELVPQRASEAAEHLSHCRECQTVAAEMQSISRRLLEWQIEELDPHVQRAVDSARLPEGTQSAWRRRGPWIVGLAAACIVVMMFARHALQERSVSYSIYSAPERQARERQEGNAASAMLDLPPADAQQMLVRPPAAAQQMAQGRTASEQLARIVDTLVIRTAQITLTAHDFAKARGSLEDILKRHGGHIGNLAIGSPADSGRNLQATLRIPSSQLDAAVAEIRTLGRVESEQQGGEEVTHQVVDLEARLANARNTEQRLADILRRSTGKITDVLTVEKEIDRVRDAVERMEAERKNLGDRVNFATLEIHILEEYKAHLALAPPSTFSRLRNSAVEGYRNVIDSLTRITMFLLAYGPALLLWAALLFFPVRYAWRRLRKSGSQMQAEEDR